MSRTTAEPDVLRHRGRCPSFRAASSAGSYTPRLDTGMATTAPGNLSRCLRPAPRSTRAFSYPCAALRYCDHPRRLWMVCPVRLLRDSGFRLLRAYGLRSIPGLFPVTGRFVCFETPSAGAALLVVGSGSLPRPPVRDPETHSRERAPPDCTNPDSRTHRSKYPLNLRKT